MRLCIFLILFLFTYVPSLCQKPEVDSVLIKNWVTINSPNITNDGQFLSYIISKKDERDTVIVKSLDNLWEKRIPGVSTSLFTGDSKTGIYKKNDSLCFLKLGSGDIRLILNVRSYEIIEVEGNEWILCVLNNSNQELIFKNLTSEETKSFFNIRDYSLSNNRKLLLLNEETAESNIYKTRLLTVKLPETRTMEIWSAASHRQLPLAISQYIFGPLNSQVAFEVKSIDAIESHNSIWYYEEGMKNAKELNCNSSMNNDSGLSITNIISFLKSGKQILCGLTEKKYKKPVNGEAVVNVWAYKDTVLQSKQLQELDNKKYLAILDIVDSRCSRIEFNDESQILLSEKNNFAIVRGKNSLISTWTSGDSLKSFYKVSLFTGKHTLFQNGKLDEFSLSPEENYVVYFDYRKSNYFSYDVITGNSINISKLILSGIYKEYTAGRVVAGTAGWINDSSILIYDNYDVWKIDVRGKYLPVNITCGFGISNKIVFRLLSEARDKINFGTGTILLCAFDKKNKQNGFYRTNLNGKKKPELLTMGPYIYYNQAKGLIPTSSHFSSTIKPIKAKNVNRWIVGRMSFNESPNLFLTDDFHDFKNITQIQTQLNYNWLNAELVTWKQLDGTLGQGILYKPENFNSNKRYPVIINYYELVSHRLFEFPTPNFSEDNINIAWFVSRGYLVLNPDINYSMSNRSNVTNGENAYNTVVSAAIYFSRKSWVNDKKIAIQGHSFGGGITNYLLTHSGIFAAAAEAAGVSDAISSYLSLGGTFNNPGESRQVGAERGQGRMGATLWERPDLYLRNSSILKANSVKSPLLIMHNKDDSAVPWAQGVEMYLSLRRLHKVVWMLQYENGGHSVYRKDAVDYTIRLEQFFNHYLKDSAAPVWMTRGIPARLKGIETGYTLDSAGSCGPNCKVCKKINVVYANRLVLKAESKEIGVVCEKHNPVNRPTGFKKMKTLIPLGLQAQRIFFGHWRRLNNNTLPKDRGTLKESPPPTPYSK